MSDYYDYLRSAEWAARTEPIRKRNRGRCECCNMRWGTEVHHRTYARVYAERKEDLLLVCHPCHQRIHKLGPAFIWASRIAFLKQLQEEAACTHSEK